MQKKAQAAMEFLMTYGWAILAAVIAIGVLAYFGVFTPGKYTTGSTVVNPPFYANAWNVKAAGVTLELKNNGGEDVTINSIVVSNCGTNGTDFNVTAGSVITYLVECAPTSGTFKGDITINYRKSGSAVDLTSTGTISEKVT